MSVRMSLYRALVNAKPGIAYRYHRVHDGTTGVAKFFSWLYLLWLNFAYYVLFCRFLGRKPEVEYYEQKALPWKESESALALADFLRVGMIPAISDKNDGGDIVSCLTEINSNRDAVSGLTDKHCDHENFSVLTDKIRDHDVISFDVFDTLLFRPLTQPADLFYFIGEKMGIPDFKNIRIWAEQDARMKKLHRDGNTEVTLKEIWENLAEDTGLSAEEGMRIETETELALCYANPFMLSVWKHAKEAGKTIIVVSDMYLPKETIKKILEKNGFTGADRIYVSCEYGKSKTRGDLYQVVMEDLLNNSIVIGKSELLTDTMIAENEKENKTTNDESTILHIGDNPHSDVGMAKKAGLHVRHYPQINRNMLLYRPYDMSCLIGSAYRGIVSAHLYNGTRAYTMEYEYGFVYGGLFVLGYCDFIRAYCAQNDIDRILFLSRDGDILKKVYDHLYPSDSQITGTEYAYFSRRAALKLMANEDRHDYFRRFVYHKVNQKYTIAEILQSMELEFLSEQLNDWKNIWTDWMKRLDDEAHALAVADTMKAKIPESRKEKKLAKIERDFSMERLEKIYRKRFTDLRPEDELTDKNAYLLRRFIEHKWEQVLLHYVTQREAAEKYFRKKLDGCKNAAVVDIGWAGSGALALSHLTEKCWKLPCRLTGIVAGTNTLHNAEPDASEPFLQSGRIVSYLYSQSHNRDLLKKHDPGKDYNVYWELLLSSPTEPFQGFYDDGNDGVRLCFGKTDVDLKKAKEIQQGIMDFVKEYRERFRDYPYMFRISGRDAYAPMLVAASHKERYLKAIAKKFDLSVNVD